MFTKIKVLKNAALRVVSVFFPDETIEKSKIKWNKLARENARYYVVSKKGKNIEEEDFRDIGKESYRKLILEDKIITKELGQFSDKIVLDIGCGIGRLEEFFARDFKEVHGIDISEEMVSKAKNRLASFNNVYLKATDGVTYPFENETFDFIFSYIVFQHMPSREVIEKNFMEVFRVLKPGAVAKIQIRGGNAPLKWKWFYGPSWSKDEALKMVKNIGFKTIKTEGEKTKLFWLWLTR